MQKIWKFSLIPAAVLIALGVVIAQEQPHGGKPLSATLSGAAEVPGPGDSDGSGTAAITLNSGQNQVCFELKVSDIAPASAAHIHIGAVDKAGPVLVGLTAPTNGSSKDCVSLDAAKIKELMKDPSAYYVNVHNAEFPAGAVRGQLSK